MNFLLQKIIKHTHKMNSQFFWYGAVVSGTVFLAETNFLYIY